MVVVSTPSPKARKAPTCRTCGKPMLGHKRNGCTSNQSSPAPARTVTKIEELEKSLDSLQLLDLSDNSKQRRRSSVMPKRPSLESLTSSAADTLELVLATTKKQSNITPPRSRAGTPRPSGVFQSKENVVPTPVPKEDDKAVARPRRSIMPGTLKLENDNSLEEFLAVPNGTLIKESKQVEADARVAVTEDSEKQNSPEPASVTKIKGGDSSPKVAPTKKRKSVRVSLPGYSRSSLRLQQAQPLDVTEADGMLRATFFKTTAQQATLFKFTSRDAAILEEAASKLGLQTHYYSRSSPKASPKEDVNWLIVGKNEKSIDDMLQTMESEASQLSPEVKPTESQVTSHFLARLTAAGVVGAAVMWAGLAFS